MKKPFALVLAILLSSVGLAAPSAQAAESAVWKDQVNSHSRTWQSIASSSDGTKLAAVVMRGGIYTSTDSGATWIERHVRDVGGDADWQSIASSKDGSKLAAVIGGDFIYTSTDSGATWIARSSGTLQWRSIASSDDGSKLAAVASNDYIYTSTDSGENWYQQNSAGIWDWQSIASSGDGSNLAAASYDGFISTSTDSGESWNQLVSAGQHAWTTIASNSDGSKLVAGTRGIGDSDIFISSDAGFSWMTVSPVDIKPSWWEGIVSLSSSSDGYKLAAVVFGGSIYTSTDEGATWTLQDVEINEAGSTSIASSSDGTKLAVASYGGDIWTLSSAPASSPSSASLVDLGVASSFGMIAQAAITNGGASTLVGDIGVFPGTAITGAATMSITGHNYGSQIQASSAQAALVVANNAITALGVGTDIAAELGGQRVCPGIYTSVAAFGLTGILTLDANNDPNAIFIFKTPAALTSAAASSIVLTGGAKASNVYWQLGAAATLGASSIFKGTILAQAAITSGAGVIVEGRLLSLGAALTIDSSSVTVPSN